MCMGLKNNIKELWQALLSICIINKDNEEIKLFEGSDGYDDGEQRRDFIYVEDVVKVNLWFLKIKDYRVYSM